MDVRSLFFAILLVLLTALAAMIVEPFLTSLLAAVLVAFVLRPVHDRLADLAGTHVSAFALVVAVFVSFVGIAYLFVVTIPADATAVVEGVEQLPALEAMETEIERRLGTSVPLESMLSAVSEQLSSFVAERASGLLGFAVHSFLGLALLVFVIYYLLVDGDRLVEWIEDVVPLESQVQSEFHREASEVTWAVLKGHAFVAVVQGIAGGIGLLLVGIPNVAFWTLVMIVLEFFPIIGVAAVIGPAVVYLLVAERILAAAFLLVYGLTAVALIDDYLRAIVVDRQSSLHSAVILVGVFGGVYVFGFMGLFVGPILLGLFGAGVRVFDKHYAP